MNFQTKATLPTLSHYSHANGFASLGSCFASALGTRLERYCFDCVTNPLGALFNPLAASELLARAVENRLFRSEEFFEHQELWKHFLVHSSFASTDPERSVRDANDALLLLGRQLGRCDLLILTLGSAWVYQKDGYAGYIGHNHRLPLSAFQKRRLTPDEISLTLSRSIKLLRNQNPNLKVCLTVSPVRHLRDGLHANNLSKATLLLAADQLASACHDVSYFPAYELLLDELRDYRFFADDLAHPSEQAIEFIWSKFRDTHFDASTRNALDELESILGMLSHRPQHVDTKRYQEFKATLLAKINSLSQTLPRAARLKARYDLLP